VRNAFSVVVIATVYAMVVFGPTAYRSTTDAICFDESSEPVATFPDMDACVLGTGARAEWRYCTCSAQDRPWARWYYLLGVPFAFTAVGAAVTSGRLLRRIVVLNIAVVGIGFALVGFYARRGTLAPEAIGFATLGVLLLAVVSSGGIALVNRLTLRRILRVSDDTP